MKKIFYALLSFVGAAIFIFFVSARKINPPVDTEYPLLGTPQNTQQAKATKQPTPTIDYQKTAQAAEAHLVIAQATSIEAARINAQATANHEDYLQSQIVATSDADKMAFDKISMTATAAGTSIPLTATAQIINSTAIANYQAMQAAQMTATHQAPAIMRDMKSAEAYNAIADFWVRIVAMGSFSIFALAVPIILFIVPRKHIPTMTQSPPVPVVVYPREQVTFIEPTDTVIRLQSQTGGYKRMDKLIVPCTAEKFDEFARGVILENRPLAINEWEGMASPFQNRDEYLRIRAFMQMNQLAQSAGNGRLILSAKGEGIFRAWIDAGEFPTEYSFEDNKISEMENK